MLFRETIAVYCENDTKHTDTLCGQNKDYLRVKIAGTYSYHYALNGESYYCLVLTVVWHFNMLLSSHMF
jgi:hypothetical protein